MTSGHKGDSAGREAPSPPSCPSHHIRLSPVRAREGLLWGGEVAERGREGGHRPQAPSLDNFLPGLLQVQGNVLNFHKMIKLKTGKSPVPNYAFYGCYCGLGGKGSHKDATDC